MRLHTSFLFLLTWHTWCPLASYSRLGAGIPLAPIGCSKVLANSIKFSIVLAAYGKCEQLYCVRKH